jgi:glycosyltransferase involved in cell wall biosynthesis
MKLNNHLITVFTPTFNRAYLLKNVHNCLAHQSYRKFEWLIIDDGSTDNTKEVVGAFIKKETFSITYLYQENQGKANALNKAFLKAKGEFFVVLDSDDLLLSDALENMLQAWSTIPAESKKKFVGIVGHWVFPNQKIVGTHFPENEIDSNAFDIRTKYRIKGDKIGMNRTEVLRKFPFPEKTGNFIPESLIWNRIAKHYQIRFVNIIFGIKEYQKSGLTDRIDEIRMQNSQIMVQYYREFVNMRAKLPLKIAVRSYSNLYRYFLHENKFRKLIFKELNRLLIAIPSIIIGALLYINDLRRFKK